MARAFAAPAPGDIVWSRFPEVEGIRPGPKPRPALVLSVMDDADPVRVRIAYGTSQKLIPVRRGEFAIQREPAVAFKLAGLSYPTKFSLTKVVVVPYTTLWFALAPLGEGLVAATPKLGVLHPSLMEAVRRAAIEAGLVGDR